MASPDLTIIPQFDAPFRLDPSGVPVVVEQDTPEEIGGAVYDILVCQQGAKLNDPEFGVPWPVGQNMPLDLSGMLAALQGLEPRAQYTLDDVAAAADEVRQIIATATVAASNPTLGA